MASIPEMYAELLVAAAVDLKAFLKPENDEDARLVQKGLMLYRQGLVSKMRLEDGAILASVQDVTMVNVRFDLNFIHSSECTCPSDSICRHLLAAFFYAYSQAGSVSQWVQEWRQPISEKKSVQKWGIQRAKDLLKSTGQLKPEYDEWINAFNESFDSIMQGKGRPKPYVIPELFQVYTRKLRAGAPVEQEWKLLYLLIGTLHSFHRLLHLSSESGHNEEEVSRYYRQIFYSLIDDITDLIDRLSIHALPFAFDEFIEKLKDDSTKLVADELELEFERAQLYRILWTQLFKKKAWREKEKEKIKDLLPKSTLPLMIGWIHQHILLQMDQEAVKMIHRLEAPITPFMLYWLEMFASQKDWKRMGPYVDELILHTRSYLAELEDSYSRMDFTKWALNVITDYCAANNDVEKYEKALIQTLPYSYGTYSEFLFDQKLYERWGELQAYIGVEITAFRTEIIKEAQQEAPAVLLPLYHQSIQKHIEMKNRGNYREAVKELKKLRTVYKKLKRQDDFDHFMAILLDKTKRLRAFQEECKRGKLTHA